MSDPAETKRQLITDAISARLKTIAPGVVFALPFADHVCQSTVKDVYPWRRTNFSLAEVPAIKIQDTDAQTGPGPSGQHEHRLRVPLEIHVAGKTAASQVRQILADVVAAIGSDAKWKTEAWPNGLAFWTELNGHEIDVEQAGDTIAAGQLQITVTYRTPLWRI